MNGETARITLFGAPQVWVAGEEVRLPAKALGLIARLAATHGGVCSRPTLSRMLWPRSGSRSSRHSLSQALYAIRKTLGTESVRSDGDNVSLGEVECDVSEFLSAVSREDWLGASRLYRGVFAQGLAVTGAPEFEHWLDAARSTLEASAARTLKEITGGSHWEDGRNLASALLASDPENRGLVRSYVGGLVATEGIPQAKAFASTLSDDLAAAASQVIEDFRTAGSHLDGDQSPTAFVGREHATKWLEQRFTDAVEGPANIVLITGEAGIGKTALIERFSKLAVLRGAKVLTASAYEAEQNLPLGIVGQWLQTLSRRDLDQVADRPWLAVLKTAFPVIGGESPPDLGEKLGEIGHHRLLESLRRLIVEMANRQPLVLVIDDIHWADSASISFTHYLLRRAGNESILIIAAVRTDREVGATRMSDLEPLARLSLRGLSTNAIDQFLRRSPISGDLLKSVHLGSLRRRTGGNPLLLSTLVREMRGSTLESGSPPQSIVDFFKPRLQSRSDSAQRLLATLCVLGGQSQFSMVAGIANLAADQARRALAELKSAQLVEESDSAIELRHGLVGEVALSLLSAPEKQRLHGRAARHMAESGSPRPPLAAISHDLAGNRKDAFEASVTASKACDVLHARTEKEFFLKLALSNAPSRSDEAGVRIDLADLYIRQRRWGEALDILNPAAFSKEANQLQYRAEAARLRIMAEMTGDTDVLKDLWRQVGALGEKLPPLTAADIFIGIARVAYDLGLDETAAEVAERIESRLTQLPLTVETGRRLLHPITIIGFRKGYEGALEKFDQLPASDAQDPVYEASFLANKATLLVAAGRLLDAEELFAASLGVIERFALFDHFHMINNNLGVCLMEQGRYDEAKQHFEVAVEYAADTSPSQHSTAPDNLTILAYERANYELALEIGNSLLTTRGVSGTRALMSLRAIVGLSGLELGSLPRCREAERELQIHMERHDRYNNDMSYVHIFLARMAAMRGQHADAIQLLQTAAQHYQSRNVLASARLLLERYRLETRQGVDRRMDLRRLLRQLRETGAIPLLDRSNSILVRATNRFA